MKRKLFLLMWTVMMTVAANAQFEKDTWYLGTSLTSLNLSHSKNEGTRFGVEALGGAFVCDGLALLISLKGDWVKYGIDETSLGTQLRYYLQSNGLYGGVGLKYTHLSGDMSKEKNLVFLTPEVGYAFFLGRNVTVEPAVYCDVCTKDFSDWSKYGLKIGFGFYFK